MNTSTQQNAPWWTNLLAKFSSTIYAAGRSKDYPSDSSLRAASAGKKGAAGDCPPPGNLESCPVHFPKEGKVTASDRGKTGAGVTGSRKKPCPDKDSDELPAGANNPGLLRYIHNAARYRLPQCFEGGSVSVKQSSQSNWILGHSLSFSSVTPGGYKLLLSYVDKSKPTGLPYFVMEAAPGGQMSCEMRVGPTQGTRATVVAQIADAEFYSFESIFDAYFNSFTASIIAVNREFIALHFLQAITEQISLGAEIVARGQATELSSASGAGRWVSDEHSISATLGNRGLDLCYARVITPYLTIAGMLEVGFAIRRAVATLAYEWRSEEWTVRGSADSDGLVGATLQRALGGKRADLACAISALLNHPNDKFRLGFGITAAIV
ncbi:mitochondrial import receptor subunit TOM40 homolog [Plodia interpunctella]|uniref:mitochondrial import receptor subunit TOM40 homolog n=1 Tax=Plodia interpunctella TaxID=58824 RepID=UPI002367455E|nr:mitochondrial import receptor subunit TOM40 homolog [Plodia interpunctella]